MSANPTASPPKKRMDEIAISGFALATEEKAPGNETSINISASVIKMKAPNTPVTMMVVPIIPAKLKAGRGSLSPDRSSSVFTNDFVYML